MKQKQKHILQCHGRLVYVGVVERVNCPIMGDGVLRITECHNIRVWGTEGKGLFSLAIEGVQPNTILDKCPPITKRIEEVHDIFPVFPEALKGFGYD